jgi:hypothetical protein
MYAVDAVDVADAADADGVKVAIAVAPARAAAVPPMAYFQFLLGEFTMVLL